MAIKAINSLS